MRTDLFTFLASRLKFGRFHDWNSSRNVYFGAAGCVLDSRVEANDTRANAADEVFAEHG
jgi:hypothetical protein